MAHGSAATRQETLHALKVTAAERSALIESLQNLDATEVFHARPLLYSHPTLPRHPVRRPQRRS